MRNRVSIHRAPQRVDLSTAAAAETAPPPPPPPSASLMLPSFSKVASSTRTVLSVVVVLAFWTCSMYDDPGVPFQTMQSTVLAELVDGDDEGSGDVENDVTAFLKSSSGSSLSSKRRRPRNGDTVVTASKPTGAAAPRHKAAAAVAFQETSVLPIAKACYEILGPCAGLGIEPWSVVLSFCASKLPVPRATLVPLARDAVDETIRKPSSGGSHRPDNLDDEEDGDPQEKLVPQLRTEYSTSRDTLSHHSSVMQLLDVILGASRSAQSRQADANGVASAAVGPIAAHVWKAKWRLLGTANWLRLLVWMLMGSVEHLAAALIAFYLSLIFSGAENASEPVPNVRHTYSTMNMIAGCVLAYHLMTWSLKLRRIYVVVSQHRRRRGDVDQNAPPSPFAVVSREVMWELAWLVGNIFAPMLVAMTLAFFFALALFSTQ